MEEERERERECVCVCREEGERECVRIDLERESEMAGKPRDGGPMPKHAKMGDFGHKARGILTTRQTWEGA